MTKTKEALEWAQKRIDLYKVHENACEQQDKHFFREKIDHLETLINAALTNAPEVVTVEEFSQKLGVYWLSLPPENQPSVPHSISALFTNGVKIVK